VQLPIKQQKAQIEVCAKPHSLRRKTNMSQELNLSKEEKAALDRIEAEVTGARTRAVGGVEASAFDLGDLCKKYQAIRGPLEILVKLVKKIPGIGAKIAAALEFLMSLADIACPVNP
jgi:hypothetical protein